MSIFLLLSIFSFLWLLVILFCGIFGSLRNISGYDGVIFM